MMPWAAAQCFTTLWHMHRTPPDVDLRVRLHPAKSESTHTWISACRIVGNPTVFGPVQQDVAIRPWGMRYAFASETDERKAVFGAAAEPDERFATMTPLGMFPRTACAPACVRGRPLACRPAARTAAGPAPWPGCGLAIREGTTSQNPQRKTGKRQRLYEDPKGPPFAYTEFLWTAPDGPWQAAKPPATPTTPSSVPSDCPHG
eukprot:gene388-biopygen243